MKLTKKKNLNEYSIKIRPNIHYHRIVPLTLVFNWFLIKPHQNFIKNTSDFCNNKLTGIL